MEMAHELSHNPSWPVGRTVPTLFSKAMDEMFDEEEAFRDICGASTLERKATLFAASSSLDIRGVFVTIHSFLGVHFCDNRT
jgi:hypothetical protein